jgi:hypothetical protein
MSLYIALVHHPVKDREGATVTTAVTNLDVHDLARSARTYDVVSYFVVTPIAAQQDLVERILEHWRTGSGSRRIPERSEALSRCRCVPSVEAAVEAVREREGAPRILATGAKPPVGRTAMAYAEGRAWIAQGPVILLFGTGHGLARELVDRADGVLAPIRPGAGYNHLSVRAAAAITLDRLFGDTV